MNSIPRLLTLSLLGFLSLTGRAFGHSAVEPVPRPDDWWRNRQQALNDHAQAAGEKAEVIFVGDSITQGWEGPGKEIWDEYYAPRNAVNLGIGGDRTQHVLWRLDHGNLDGLKPKAAVVMIGTNNSNGEDNTIDQIADGVTAIVEKLRKELPETTILLLPIFPRAENPCAQRGKILQVNQIIQKLVDDKSVLWMDFGYKYIRSDGSIPHDLMPDYLHPNAAGYKIWAESMEPTLAKVLGESARSPKIAQDESPAAPSLSGNWVATMPRPNGDPVDVPFTLTQNGNDLQGAFQRPDGRSLKIENGRIAKGRFSWTLNRDRSDGSVMRYEISGKAEGDRLVGTARTDVEGNAVSREWTAKRR